MITVSDNASAVALTERLGYSAINGTMRDVGLERTVVGRESTTTPRDMLKYFEMLAGLEAVDPESSVEMLERLLRQRINDRIPRLLPPGTLVAHKTGDNPGIVHDAGLIYTPAGPVAVALLAQSVRDGAAVRVAMANFGARIYEYADNGFFGEVEDPPFLWDPGR